MQTTAELLDRAMKTKPAQTWHQELGLSRNALHVARAKGKLSPIVAGAIAEKLGENVPRWMAIAALESEKESGAKDHLVKTASGWLDAAKL